MRLFYILSATMFLTIACRKKELPVPLPDKGDILTGQSDLGPDYKRQMYFDLGTGVNVGENHKTIWDIGIANDSNFIVLNAAKVMYAAPVYNANFDEIVDTTGFSANRRWDAATGNRDSLALNGHHLFIIDRGIDENGIAQGWVKFEVLNHTVNSFEGKVAKLDGSNEEIFSIQKETRFNYTHISFQNGANVVSVQPEKDKWDLYISQYTHVYWNPDFFPYIVVGILSNPSGQVKMKEVTNIKTFEEIDYDFASNTTLSSRQDLIGFEWKHFNGSVYSIDTHRTWVIQDTEGFYYKFRLIDFYNSNGLKGCPTFEYQRL